MPTIRSAAEAAAAHPGSSVVLAVDLACYWGAVWAMQSTNREGLKVRHWCGRNTTRLTEESTRAASEGAVQEHLAAFRGADSTHRRS